MKPLRSTLQGGALAGFILLIGSSGFGDEPLREQVRAQYKQQSYLLVEDQHGIRLYLFENDGADMQPNLQPDQAPTVLDDAIAKLQSADPRARVRGLTELAGMSNPQALDAALTLLTDPSPAVRHESAQLILDHPDGAALVSALGLTDDDKDEDEDEEGY